MTESERLIYERGFRAGFEHAVAGGEEASGFFTECGMTAPLVLYFNNDTDRREMIDAIQLAKPGMIETKVPEQRK